MTTRADAGSARGPGGKVAKAGARETASARRPRLAAMGMEAELTLHLDGVSTRPEDAFGDPRAFIRGPLVHRTGTSYHLPNGGAVYFDTGVIEVATPLIELGRGCAARAGRSLWEALRFVRDGLDAWERREARDARLAGFSTHYNVSFRSPNGGAGRTVDELAHLLAHILPVPVMLLATNRRSTGVGVRPRGDRLEVTVDFTPSAALMIATGTLVVGVVRGAMAWPTYRLGELARHGVPVIAGYAPVPHTSRQGWLAAAGTYPRDPFRCDPDVDRWATTAGEALTLREIGGRIARLFWRPVRRLSDPFTFRLIGAVLSGRAPSLLDLDDRPPEYDDVGRLCDWNDLFTPDELPRSRYERVLIHAIAGRRLRLAGRWYRPIGMRGWSEVVFRRDGDGERRTFSIDYLLGELDAWEEGPEPGRARRRRARRPRRRTRKETT